MSRQKSTDEPYAGPYRKPRFDLYSVLLLLALAAIITATVLLYLETTDYPSPPFKGTPQVFWNPSSVPIHTTLWV